MCACLAGCLAQGQPVIAERPQVADEGPPRTERHAPIIPAPGQPRRATEPEPQARPAAPPAPKRTTRSSKPSRRPVTYLVREGDTLYSIAFRFDLDPRGLARANAVPAPYTIFPGQSLRLTSEAPKSEPRVAKKPRVNAPKPTPSVPVPKVEATWRWPVAGAPSRRYGRGNRGVDFNVGSRQPVRASNGGEVVYAGAGIGGYSQLIILKHTDALLSAYSFNGETLVREQQSVKAGGVLADIIPRGKSIQRLHFEIRRNGEPVNPSKYVNR